MEIVKETIRGNDQFLVNKGLRTKRPRPSSPFSLASSSNVGGEDGVSHDGHGNNDGSSSSAAMSTIEFFKNTEDEEDMAECLILLAQGNREAQRRNKRKDVDTRGASAVYECKTCSRSFPSFQALGGHRASHRKPKAIINEEKKDLHEGKFNSNNTNPDQPLFLQADPHHMAGNNNNKPKVHECSICGSEFSSGQALGGHMRRHRNTTAPMNDQKSRNVFMLDLNLPAPEEDAFGSKQLPLIFSPPALVDCHY